VSKIELSQIVNDTKQFYMLYVLYLISKMQDSNLNNIKK